MQKIKLEKSEAFSVLVKEYPKYFTHGEGRFLVAGKWDAEGFSVFSFGEDISIMYKEESDLFRALGQLMAEMRKRDGGEIKIRQVPPMNFRSVMIDVSRNAVIKPEYLKKILLKLSLLGINYVCLYTEDTYEVTGHPLIGYNRGRYSKAEIRDVSVFAKKIGITMFPCIQTLGHLEQILKFPAYYRFKDNDKVLNVKNPKIYAFVEQLIKNATEPYDTDLIHIGMDETHGLGLGKAFEHGKPVDPRKLYQAHTAKVINICRKLNLK
ncbi:MAG: family 20 glycosylhydrolase, partial [Candidatus Firestonebacteria bacterium]